MITIVMIMKIVILFNCRDNDYICSYGIHASKANSININFVNMNNIVYLIDVK